MIALLSAAAFAWTFDLEVGGQFEASSHGIANFYARHEGWELGLITDTLQVRYDGYGARGRWWGAARVQLGAAGLVSTRWVDGAPSPEESQLGFYAGPEGGGVVYLPHGFYVGAQAAVRYYMFAGLPQTAEVAESRPVASAEAIGGWWSETAEVWVRAGVTHSKGWVPGAHLVARLHPRGTVAPWVVVHAGGAENAEIVTYSRLGGLNPYVVPLAGAAWAEFWVEDYAAVRAGPRFRADEHWVAPFVDAALFDGREAWGLGGMAHAQLGRVGFDVGAGVSPGAVRPNRTWSGCTYVLMTAALGRRSGAEQ